MYSQNLEKRIESLKALQHNHIVQYYGTERSDSSISVFMEYMPGVSIGVDACIYIYYYYAFKQLCSYSNRTVTILSVM